MSWLSAIARQDGRAKKHAQDMKKLEIQEKKLQLEQEKLALAREKFEYKKMMDAKKEQEKLNKVPKQKEQTIYFGGFSSGGSTSEEQKALEEAIKRQLLKEG